MPELSLDLIVHICEFLRPPQILALRQTCKTFHEATSQRIIWIHALNRICHENLLFFPTFPIADMSDAELERAATAPSRWIALSSLQVRKKELPPLCATRVIKSPIALMCFEYPGLSPEDILVDMYLVPGGRYLVARSPHCLCVWDLGYVSDGDMSSDRKPTKIWATTVESMGLFFVHPTPDGLGLRILACDSPRLLGALYVFEIYPQRETPQLAKLAELILHLREDGFKPHSLNGNRVIIYNRWKGIIIVWDFMANTVARWYYSNFNGSEEIFRVTETAIMILHRPLSLSIFQIPPLKTTETPLFDIEDLPEVAPILTFKYPEGPSFVLEKLDEWYHGDFSSPPLYFDMFEGPQMTFSRCKLDIASDFSSASLTPIVNTSNGQRILDTRGCYHRLSHRICEDRNVNIPSRASTFPVDLGLFSDSPPPRSPTLHTNDDVIPFVISYTACSFCPASARVVYRNDLGDIGICDFL